GRRARRVRARPRRSCPLPAGGWSPWARSLLHRRQPPPRQTAERALAPDDLGETAAGPRAEALGTRGARRPVGPAAAVGAVERRAAGGGGDAEREPGRGGGGRGRRGRGGQTGGGEGARPPLRRARTRAAHERQRDERDGNDERGRGDDRRDKPAGAEPERRPRDDRKAAAANAPLCADAHHLARVFVA